MGVVQEEINSALWEYQLTDTKWTTYPKSISLLIERQFKNQKNHNGKYIPIFYQKSNGNKFKVNLETSLQFDLQNNSVAMIRRQNHSEKKSLNYNKCPHCLFKISPSAQTCNICNTNIQEYMFKQYNDNGNHNNNNQKKQFHDDDDIKMGDNNKNKNKKEQPKEELPPKANNILQSDEIKCPFCQTKNQKNFNFCVGCSFDLREYQPKPVPVKHDKVDNKLMNVDDVNMNQQEPGIGNNAQNNNDNNNDQNNSNVNVNNVSDDFDPFAEDFDGPDDSDRNKSGAIIFNAQQPGSGDIPPNIVDEGDIVMNGEGEGGGGPGGAQSNANANNNDLQFAQDWH